MIFDQYVVEIDAWTGLAVETIKISGNPAFDSTCLPYLIDPGLLKTDAFSSGKTYGESKYSYGEIVVSNIAQEAVGELSGPLDYFKDYSFDGRTVRVYQGTQGAAYNTFELIFTTIIESVSFSWDGISFALRSRQAELDIDLDGGTFLGNNVLPAGVEGVESDLKDKAKPILLGRAFNALPVLCNTSKLIYAMSPSTGVAQAYMGSEFQVYDNGIPLMSDGFYADQAAMELTAPNAGTYSVWEAGGYFRLGSSPAGTVTFDGASFGRSVTAKASNIIEDALTMAGHASMIDASSFAALAVAAPFEVGLYLPKATPISKIIDELCSSCGAYWYFDNTGKMILKQFVDPSGLTVDKYITVDSIVEDFKKSKTKDTVGGIPAYKITFNFAKNNHKMTKAAGSATPERLAWLSEPWRSFSVEDINILTTHPLSEELVIDTSLTKANGAEAIRRFNLYSVEREIVSFNTPLEGFGSANNINLGMCFDLDLNARFDYAHKKMVLIGYTVNNVKPETVTLTLWG